MALGVENIGGLIADYDETEVADANVDTATGDEVSVTCLSIRGICRLLEASEAAHAKPLERWLFHEVMPALARAGSDVGKSAAPPPPTTVPDAEALAATAHAREVELAKLELQRRERDDGAVAKLLKIADSAAMARQPLEKLALEMAIGVVRSELGLPPLPDVDPAAVSQARYVSRPERYVSPVV